MARPESHRLIGPMCNCGHTHKSSTLSDDEYGRFLAALEREATANADLRNLLDDSGVRWRNE